jgi:hypothetical protein
MVASAIHPQEADLQTMDDRLFTSRQVCAVSGLPKGTLCGMRARGMIPPAAIPGSRGQRKSDLWSFNQFGGIAIMRNTRLRGAPLSAALCACNCLMRQSMAAIREQFAVGKTHLLLVGDSCWPALCSPESIPDNPAVDIQAAQLLAVPVVTIDVQAAFAQLEDHLRRHLAKDQA